ncbi:heterogeneous nuclear ribonucleoprotein 1-like [Primulina huaijiensis]|uniref:heterogeneous nuclear ribonucleoprotein 1-like n=1 Tax=Primulina huaijiensis TaxID=1492673 RepID=UPI003CC71331
MEMDSGKLFIGGISWETTEERLTDYFQTFGEVVQAVIMKDRITGRSRGFGFIVFASASVAERVLKGRHIVDGRAVEAKRAVPRDDNQNSTRNNSGAVQSSPSPARTRKIFVGGLASTITEIEFKRYFDKFGTTTDVVVMYDHNTGRPRGFGFVTYDSEEAVDKVLANTFHELNGKMVEVKRAVPKELSPGPTRSQPSGYNYGLNRLSSFLNAHTQGYNSNSAGGYGMRMDGRFSPATVGRNGYPPHSPSKYDVDLNLDTGFGSNYGAIGDSVNGHGRGVPSHYTGNSDRFNNSIGGNVGSFGDMWDFSHVSTQVEGTGSLISGNMGYGSGERNFLGREINIRNNGGYTDSTQSYFVTDNFREAGLENIYEGDSFFGDRGGRLLPLELEGSSSFNYGFETTAPNVTPKNSIGYVGDYIGANRATRSNRGIAA